MIRALRVDAIWSPAKARAFSSRRRLCRDNNHVVDKAETVEVTADDGKIYNARVIGTIRDGCGLDQVDGATTFLTLSSPTEIPHW